MTIKVGDFVLFANPENGNLRQIGKVTQIKESTPDIFNCNIYARPE
jgi:hypothetical protein